MLSTDTINRAANEDTSVPGGLPYRGTERAFINLTPRRSYGTYAEIEIPPATSDDVYVQEDGGTEAVASPQLTYVGNAGDDRARFVSNSWAAASQNLPAVRAELLRLGGKVHETDDYYNYCQLKVAANNCSSNDECGNECSR